MMYAQGNRVVYEKLYLICTSETQNPHQIRIITFCIGK